MPKETTQDYMKWKTSQAEFMGFVKAKLENIESNLVETAKINAAQQEQISEVKNRLTSIETRSATIGGVFGALAGVLAAVVGWLFGR